MFQLLPRLKRLWLYVRGSIAFVPALWVAGFILLAVVMRYLEAKGLSNTLGGKGDFWIISSEETARTILSSVIGGILSLTVFSFSMVMIVLSQATTTLSPRLLPQLIRDRSHQNTLGLYLGVIMFAYLTLVGVNPRENWNMNSFSIFFTVLLAVVCLSFFVYFIASIARRIQVGEVIKDVHRRAVNDFKHWQSSPEGWSLRALPQNVENWHPVKVISSGYVDVTLYSELSSLAGRFDTRFFLVHPRAEYVNRGEILFTSERPLTNDELQQTTEAVILTDNREKEFWYLPAMRHITEVAVKAMSPGINDPGTAVEAVNLLSDLFLWLQRLPNFNHYQNGNKDGHLFFATRPFTDVLYRQLAQLRTYSAADPAVMNSLAHLLKSLRHNIDDQEVLEAIEREREALRKDGISKLHNEMDREHFLRALTG